MALQVPSLPPKALALSSEVHSVQSLGTNKIVYKLYCIYCKIFVNLLWNWIQSKLQFTLGLGHSFAMTFE